VSERQAKDVLVEAFTDRQGDNWMVGLFSGFPMN
jgi:hypothetical protein